MIIKESFALEDNIKKIREKMIETIIEYSFFKKLKTKPVIYNKK